MNSNSETFCPLKSLFLMIETEHKKKKKCCKNYKHSKRCKSCPKD